MRRCGGLHGGLRGVVCVRLTWRVTHYAGCLWFFACCRYAMLRTKWEKKRRDERRRHLTLLALALKRMWIYLRPLRRCIYKPCGRVRGRDAGDDTACMHGRGGRRVCVLHMRTCIHMHALDGRVSCGRMCASILAPCCAGRVA